MDLLAATESPAKHPISGHDNQSFFQPASVFGMLWILSRDFDLHVICAASAMSPALGAGYQLCSAPGEWILIFHVMISITVEHGLIAFGCP